MIFMRDRRPEQGHNAIAHDLVHGPFIAVHGRHHALQYRIEELARLLRVAVGQQLHGPFQSAKSTVTRLRSPVSALRDVKIFSAR